MVKPNPETVQMVENLLEALAELRSTTRSTEVVVRRALKLAKDGADVATALQACRPIDTRHAMNDALKGVEAARHTMRLQIFELGLAQGLTIGELGRIFGFSRQLAARISLRERGEGD
jgi:hypothetical protein